MENLKTVAEVSEILRFTPQNVRKLIKNGALEAEKIGTQWVVSEENLKKYLAENTIEPKDHSRSDYNLPNIVALSFFSGAMGLDIGMEQGGIQALLACEFDKYCRMTIEKNRPEIALIGDIRKYSAQQILDLAKIPEGRTVDVIFGGPPCQAFSTAGARRALDDERGNVFLTYLDRVAEIRPTYVVIENVRGLLSAPYPWKDIEAPIKGGALLTILERLEGMGYSVTFELYNAANFGTPQTRERVILIGKLGDQKVPYLVPTHSENGEFNLPPWKTLGECLNESKILEHHFINFPEKRLRFYRLLKAGQYWKDLPPDLWEEAMGSKLKLGGGKTGFLRRLSLDKPSPTLVTHPAMPATDLCHPTEDRPLSVEEYKMIQEFPEEWTICGPILEQYKQIGNAVPIQLGKAIAKAILDDMHGTIAPFNELFPYSRYKNTNDKTWRNHVNILVKEERLKIAQQTLI